jgi:ribosomal protein S3
MGQKVHPLGFRVGITKKHQSQWFARFNKNKYSQSVLEDRMIRDTLSKLFPELLNPALNAVGAKKREQSEQAVTPRITQIKIERGLIPYEIGIQIHAENCDLLKSAIDNLKVKRELIVKLQKTRRYLLNLKLKLKDLTNNNFAFAKTELNSHGEQEMSTQTSLHDTASKNKVSQTKLQSKGVRSNGKKKVVIKKSFKFRQKLTKQELRRQRLIKKRLRKRQSIRRRYRQLILKGLFIKKTGTKITQTLSLNSAKKLRKGENAYKQTNKTRFNATSTGVKNKNSIKGVDTKQKALSLKNSGSNTFTSRIKKKFVTLFIQKMNKKFLAHLKVLLINNWENATLSNSNVLPLGYSKKWSFNHRVATLKTQPIYKLNRLVVVLEQKLLVKLESLRKEFIAFGSISARSSESFGYFQIVNFLKNLKELINKLKREQKLSALSAESKQSISKNTPSSGVFAGNLTQTSKQSASNKLKVTQSTTLALAETVLQKKLNNIEDECRKIKFIEYLKDIVKKHRTENIYFYLSTLADAKKDLRKIKQFTKRHADFLFGLNLKNSNSGETFKEKINERVNKVLEKATKKADFEKTLQDVFLEQIEKQRNMCLQNLQLTPKIAIKFYSVNKKTLEQKASVVSESVVDALEKRKAFRKVIKDAKETLMRTPGVKGVKIQVAGRLNGAEIARTEWVRAGRVPLQTLRANLDYSYRTASTIYGIIGVRVWIFKGYAKLINK